jgi:Flp pilus assembly protein TadG
MEAMGDVVPLMFSVVIFFVALGLWIYSRAMAQQGVLT